MLDIDKISKSFGSKNLFADASFKVNRKERIGLVGRNGYGKTTLFRIIIGQENADNGKILIPKNYRIGYLEQDIVFSEKTVLKEGMQGLIKSEKDHYWKVLKILSGLGFSKNDVEQNPNNLSDGFQVRLNLAKVLVSEPDLLLLDEPTNYLDINSIRWAVNFFTDWPKELIVITHDRGFMDKIVTHIVGIHRKKIRKIKGNSDQFYDHIAQDEEIYEKTRLNDAKKEKEIMFFVERFRAKARLAGMVQSRIKTISKTKKKNELEKLKSLDFFFKNKSCESRSVLSIKDVSFFSKNKEMLFENLSFSVKAKDRICVIGKNGKGKTTLLKIIANIIKPTTGTVVYNPQIVKGVFEQNSLNSLLESRTVEEEILYSHKDISRNEVRKVCGAMLFEGDYAKQKIGVLSGGEKNRVLLAKLLVTPLNLLLLDEPTNHLDMESSDALLAAIDNFEGTVIMVTHNEMFLNALATRLIVFDAGKAELYEGGYQRFLDKKGWEDEIVSNKRKNINKKTISKKEIRRLRSDMIRSKSKVITPIKKEMVTIELMIEKHESKVNQLNRELISASQNKNGIKIKCLYQEIHKCKKIIEDQFDELEKMENKLLLIQEKFDSQLLL